MDGAADVDGAADADADFTDATAGMKRSSHFETNFKETTSREMDIQVPKFSKTRALTLTLTLTRFLLPYPTGRSQTTIMDGLDALRVVANVSCGEVAAERDALRNELVEVKAALEAVKSKAAEDAKKYEKLVWIARRDVDAVLADPEHPSRPSVVEVMAKYPLELQELIGEHADWQHGFNSGLLAASRMYMGIGASPLRTRRTLWKTAMNLRLSTTATSHMFPRDSPQSANMLWMSSRCLIREKMTITYN